MHTTLDVLKSITCAALVAALLAFAPPAAHAAPVSIDARLLQQVNALPLGLTPVIITYDHQPTSSDLLGLRTLGILGGVKLQQLPVVLTAVTRAQFQSLRNKPGIVSLYANRTMRLFTNESRGFIGVNAMQSDAAVTAANGGLPVSGKDVGVAYVDTGIDATHPDLQLGQNVAQNVFFPLAEVPAEIPSGFVPPIGIENNPMTDVEGGHGTFGAAVVAGTGEGSGGLYGGVAPGAKLVGLVAGNDVGLSSFAILQAFDYALVNQFAYNIRVCNNSWGTTLADAPYDANDPINVATRRMHDRNIVVVFAAGNDGDAPDMINPYSCAPWVISVAAGEKNGLGTPAGFSSRGNDNGTGTDVAGQPADPSAPPNFRPDLTGSGVDIKSARSKAPGVTNFAGTIPAFVGANDLSTIAPAYLPFYTTSQGTSFSCPQVSGVVALMLEANPTLTPDEVVTILRSTATPMPYEERVVGAGYVDAHNAVRAALALDAVDHPANLFPVPGGPEILDAADDQLGTTSQDIREADLSYDAAAGQVVYRMTVADLATQTPNMRWTVSSNFGATTVFVTTSIDETGAVLHEYGKITTLATGTQNQETLGPADAGDITGSTVTVRLAVSKIDAAVGAPVLGTTSTAVGAETQILVGTSFTGGLLLNSDQASGSDFTVAADESGDPDPDPDPEPAPDGPAFDERYSGALAVGGTVDVPVDVRRSSIDAKINFAPGNEPVTFALVDPAGNVVATSSNKRLTAGGLSVGTYVYRVSGAAAKPVDFTIKSTQGQ
jgi:subtilisin family serine protease